MTYFITNITNGMRAQVGDDQTMNYLWNFAANASGPIIVSVED